ncbi:MAG: hypothetical protein ACXAC7_21215 [Candidatus Hodarchaeales archaeon]|jgi:Ca2+/Na+ antiporter
MFNIEKATFSFVEWLSRQQEWVQLLFFSPFLLLVAIVIYHFNPIIGVLFFIFFIVMIFGTFKTLHEDIEGDESEKYEPVSEKIERFKTLKSAPVSRNTKSGYYMGSVNEKCPFCRKKITKKAYHCPHCYEDITVYFDYF